MMKERFFGTNLKYFREKLGLEQKELAEMIGLKSGSVISEWESCKRVTNIGILHDLSVIFGVTIDSLVYKDLTQDNFYYLNPETSRYAQMVHENSDLRMLFDATRNMPPEDIKRATEIIKLLKDKENGEQY